MSTEDEIRNASRQFYAGLNRMANGNAAPLADTWSHRADVTAMHPIGDRQIGWDLEVLSRLETRSRKAAG